MGVEWQSEVMKETYSGRHFLLMKQRLKHSTIITYKAFIAFKVEGGSSNETEAN